MRRRTHLGVGVSQLDGNVSLQFVLEPDGLHSGDGLYDSRFTMGYVTDSTDVDLECTQPTKVSLGPSENSHDRVEGRLEIPLSFGL